MSIEEIQKLSAYLRKRFNDDKIVVRARPNKTDSAEVYAGKDEDAEFIGVIFKDEDEGEISYDFNMAILDIDLD